MKVNWVDYILMGIIAVIVVVDVYLAHNSEQETISWRMTMWGKKWPIIWVMIGILIGHLTFPNHAFCP